MTFPTLHLLSRNLWTNSTESQCGRIAKMCQTCSIFRMVHNRTKPSLFLTQMSNVFQDNLPSPISSSQANINIFSQIIAQYLRFRLLNIHPCLVRLVPTKG